MGDQFLPYIHSILILSRHFWHSVTNCIGMILLSKLCFLIETVGRYDSLEIRDEVEVVSFNLSINKSANGNTKFKLYTFSRK